MPVKDSKDANWIEVEPYWNVNTCQLPLKHMEKSDWSRTILECKSSFGIRECSWLPIEVEPYWNVNVSEGSASVIVSSIEVEPYWNVNVEQIKRTEKRVELK